MNESFFILTLGGSCLARVRKSRSEGFPSLEIEVLFDSESQRDLFIRACLSDAHDTVEALRESPEIAARPGGYDQTREPG